MSNKAQALWDFLFIELITDLPDEHQCANNGTWYDFQAHANGVLQRKGLGINLDDTYGYIIHRTQMQSITDEVVEIFRDRTAERDRIQECSSLIVTSSRVTGSLLDEYTKKLNLLSQYLISYRISPMTSLLTSRSHMKELIDESFRKKLQTMFNGYQHQHALIEGMNKTLIQDFYECMHPIQNLTDRILRIYMILKEAIFTMYQPSSVATGDEIRRIEINLINFLATPTHLLATADKMVMEKDITDFIDVMKTHPLSRPVTDTFMYSPSVPTVPKVIPVTPTETVSLTPTRDEHHGLSANAQQLLAACRTTSDWFVRKDVETLLNCDQAAACSVLRELKHKNLITQAGKGQGITYQVRGSQTNANTEVSFPVVTADMSYEDFIKMFQCEHPFPYKKESIRYQCFKAACVEYGTRGFDKNQLAKMGCTKGSAYGILNQLAKLSFVTNKGCKFVPLFKTNTDSVENNVDETPTSVMVTLPDATTTAFKTTAEYPFFEDSDENKIFRAVLKKYHNESFSRDQLKEVADAIGITNSAVINNTFTRAILGHFIMVDNPAESDPNLRRYRFDFK